MWTSTAARGPVALGLGLEVLEGQAQVVAAAVDEHRAAARGEDGQRRGHEGVRGAQDVRARRRPRRPAPPARRRPSPRTRPPARRSRRPRPPRSARSSRPATTAGSRGPRPRATWSRPRSRGSKPMAKRSKAGTALIVAAGLGPTRALQGLRRRWCSGRLQDPPAAGRGCPQALRREGPGRGRLGRRPPPGAGPARDERAGRRAGCGSGGSRTSSSCGSGPCAGPTSRRWGTPRRTGRCSAPASSTSGPRRRWSPTTRASSSPRRTSTATRPSWSAWTASPSRTSTRSIVEAWLARAPARLVKAFLDARA